MLEPREPGSPLPLDCPVINALADLAANRASRAVDAARSKVQAAAVTMAETEEAQAADATSSDGRPSKRRRSAAAHTPAPIEPSSVGSRGGSKGLRHFSMKVCAKVEARGRTTYNEVADELVAELSHDDDGGGCEGVHYDEKNIRRRVYDAINVLMAMGIIGKEKKAVVWQGFPQASRRLTAVEHMRNEHCKHVLKAQQKLTYLQDLIEKQRALKYLLERPDESGDQPCTKLHLPFILIQAQPDCEVVVKISEDMMDVHFDFINAPFQIHDDSYVLRHLVQRNAAAQDAATVGGASAVATATAFGGADAAAPVPAAACSVGALAQGVASGVKTEAAGAPAVVADKAGTPAAVVKEEAGTPSAAGAPAADSPLSCVPNGHMVQSVRVQRATRRSLKSPIGKGAAGAHTPTGGVGVSNDANGSPTAAHQQPPPLPSHVSTVPNAMLAGMANPMLAAVV